MKKYRIKKTSEYNSSGQVVKEFYEIQKRYMLFFWEDATYYENANSNFYLVRERSAYSSNKEFIEALYKLLEEGQVTEYRGRKIYKTIKEVYLYDGEDIKFEYLSLFNGVKIEKNSLESIKSCIDNLIEKEQEKNKNKPVKKTTSYYEIK